MFRELLNRLHNRLGDFWWYSLMIFMAARAADCLNVFVGLWLVPKYVEPSELGAVMPLTQFANFLALPAAVFASTFRNELTGLAVRNEFGKMKTLMRSVFIATAIFLFAAIVVSRFLLPHFLERIRIVDGSLGMLIIVMSFVTTVAPIYQNALQSLKKFKAITVINLLGAPIRLLTMLATIPLRALSGYFVGQISTPSFSIATSLFALRKELKVKAEPYWTKPIIKRFSKLFFIFGIGAVIGGFTDLVPNTIIRQRLPELDSAAYYIVTRFSDIAAFLYSAIVITLFPFAAALSSKGKSMLPMIFKSAAVIGGVNLMLATCFAFFGQPILELLPNGDRYCAYWWAIPWIIGINTLMQISCLYTTAETAANHFRNMLLFVPLNIAYAGLLLLVTGYGYFSDIIPAGLNDFLAEHNVRTLGDMLLWFTGYHVIRLGLCFVDYFWVRPRDAAPTDCSTSS